MGEEASCLDKRILFESFAALCIFFDSPKMEKSYLHQYKELCFRAFVVLKHFDKVKAASLCQEFEEWERHPSALDELFFELRSDILNKPASDRQQYTAMIYTELRRDGYMFGPVFMEKYLAEWKKDDANTDDRHELLEHLNYVAGEVYSWFADERNADREPDGALAAGLHQFMPPAAFLKPVEDSGHTKLRSLFDDVYTGVGGMTDYFQRDLLPVLTAIGFVLPRSGDDWAAIAAAIYESPFFRYGPESAGKRWTWQEWCGIFAELLNTPKIKYRLSAAQVYDKKIFLITPAGDGKPVTRKGTLIAGSLASLYPRPKKR